MGVHERSVSESSDDICIVPLDFGDLKRRLIENREGELRKGKVISSSEDEGISGDALSGAPTRRFFSVVMGIKRKKIPAKPALTDADRSTLVRHAWKNAARKALIMCDPWGKFHLDRYPTERARRHRYHALKKRWVVDQVVVKMERESFNRGAMRECFRMKKLSNFDKNDDWSRAHNYVAKRYMNADVKDQTYFEDVKLQMDAKLWGEEYNRHNPPKKIDIFQMAILEMTERPGSPLFHVEHFIEGKYIKYNSNSGFVRSEAHRMTPQAFSHFTFERSGHELIVVDIQGVGDLYTDPQIHTCSGSDYGDGNLSTRGMALFFHSHICNSICASLGLTQFDLAPSEIKASKKLSDAQKMCKTVVRGTEEHAALPSQETKESICHHMRLRTLSSGYYSGEDRDRLDSIGSCDSADLDDLKNRLNFENEESLVDSVGGGGGGAANVHGRRTRYDSATDFGDNTETKETESRKFDEMLRRKSRPSHVYTESDHSDILERLKEDLVEESNVEQRVLGAVHLDLAKYHELNRFTEENEDYDRAAALFHLRHAAKCNNLDAVLAMAQIHLGVPHDVLPDLELDEDERDASEGFEYLVSAAKAGDRAAIVKVATCYETGIGLPPRRCVDWLEAAFWFDAAVREIDDRDGKFDGTLDTPKHDLLARLARLYRSGGHGLAKDPNKAGELLTAAADLATEAMKGKLAAKYYMEAEEAWTECEEE